VTTSSRSLFVSARHSWSATPALTTETLASWNDARLRNHAGTDSGNGLLQISALASWRPRPGDLGYSEQAPLAASATVRVSEAVQRSRFELPRARAVSLAAGVAKDLSREWRLNGGLNFSRLEVWRRSRGRCLQRQSRRIVDARGFPPRRLALQPVGRAVAGGERPA
jgi:hypothetical protein